MTDRPNPAAAIRAVGDAARQVRDDALAAGRELDAIRTRGRALIIAAAPGARREDAVCMNIVQSVRHVLGEADAPDLPAVEDELAELRAMRARARDALRGNAEYGDDSDSGWLAAAAEILGPTRELGAGCPESPGRPQSPTITEESDMPG